MVSSTAQNTLLDPMLDSMTVTIDTTSNTNVIIKFACSNDAYQSAIFIDKLKYDFLSINFPSFASCSFKLLLKTNCTEI